MVGQNFQHDYRIKWSWTKIFANDTKNFSPPAHTVQGQNFQRGTKIFSTMFEKMVPDQDFQENLLKILVPGPKFQ